MEMASRVMSLVLVVLMGYSCSSQAYTFYVGGDEGWVLSPSHVSYNRWAEMNRFQINDTLVFKYEKGSDSVLVVTREDYERCNKDSPLQIFKDGNTLFKFHESGPFFFISGRTQHCEKGQKLVTMVLSDRRHDALPSPTTSPPMKPPSPSHNAPFPSQHAPTPTPAPSSHHAPAPTPSPLMKPPTQPRNAPPPFHHAPTPTPAPSSHHAPAPTPHPNNAPPPHSTISAPTSKAPYSSPTRSPTPNPSPAPNRNPPHPPSHSPSPSPSPSPNHQAPTPHVTPTQSPDPHLAPSQSPKAESPKSDDDGDHHPVPSPHAASSPAYPHHAPAPAPSAARGLSSSFSVFVGILSLVLSLLHTSFI